MRILHVINSLSPAQGGPPESVRQLVQAYHESRVEIEVVCLDSPSERFLEQVGCPVHALGESFLGRYSFSPRLWRWLNNNASRFDAIVANGIWTFIGLATRYAARRSDLPYGVFIHGALDPWFNKRYPLKHLKKLIYWPLQYAVLRDANAVFFTTEVERDLAKHSFRPNDWCGIVVPYGICDPDFSGFEKPDPARQIDAFFRELPNLRDRRFLLFLGRIHEKKGCDLLVEAFARLASSTPEVDLVIAGPDAAGLRAKLQERCTLYAISERVHWPGRLQGEVKWGALRACDAFVLPSHQENFGIAVVEALAVGRPVMISDQVNIWKDIVADQAGFAEEDTVEGTERMLRRWFMLTEAERKFHAMNARPSFLKRYLMIRAVDVINHALILRKCDNPGS